MGRCRVVAPAIERLPLSDGDWLDVKKELNAGDYYNLMTARRMRLPFAMILAYVVAWSLVGLDGKPLPWDIDGDEQLRRDTVGSLDKATFSELMAVLNKHETAEDAAIEAKKKTSGIAPASSPTSEFVAT